jgi:stress response protein YsnF
MASFENHTLKQKARITNLLENLRAKVKFFTVVNHQGKILGEVKDLIIDANRKLTFVISQTIEPKKRYFQLKSHLVERIDSKNKIIVTNVEDSKVKELSYSINNSEQENEDLIRKEEIPKVRNSKKESINSDMENNFFNSEITTDNTTENNNKMESVIAESVEPIHEEIVRLLGEKLVVNRSKRKVGEVIVRKEIETRMLQIPVRHEKLIVEQVSPEQKQLAEIDLGHEEISEIELESGETLNLDNVDSNLSVTGEFHSPKIASLLLNAIALEQNHGCKKVRVTIFVEDEKHQQTYQEWFTRTSNSKYTQK